MQNGEKSNMHSGDKSNICTMEKSYRSVTIVILVTKVANEVGRDTQGDQTCQIRWQDPMCAIVVWTCQLS